MRSEIVTMARNTFNLLKSEGRNVTSSQINKYLAAVDEADNLEEYVIFLKYHLKRNHVHNKVINQIEQDVREIAQGGFEQSKKNIAYYFGIMARLMKIERALEGGKNDEA